MTKNQITTFVTAVAALKWPALHEKRAFQVMNPDTGELEDRGEPMHRATLIFPFVTKDEQMALKPLNDYCAAVCDATHGEGTFKSREMFKDVVPNGEMKSKFAGFGEGTRYIATSSKFPVRLMHAKSEHAMEPTDENCAKYFYQGAYVRAIVQGFAYGGQGHTDPKTGAQIKPGVKLYLIALEHVGDGTPLDDNPAPSEDDVANQFKSAGTPVVHALPAGVAGAIENKPAAAAPPPPPPPPANDLPDEDIPF